VLKASLVAVPDVSITVVGGALVLVKEFQASVTVKLLLPAESPVTVHVVADMGDPEVPHVPPGRVPPLAVTK
jgi:hypothetical protein